MNLMFVIDILSSLLNRIVTMLKITLRISVVGTGELSDNLWKMEKVFNLIRVPFLNNSFSNIFVAQYNKDVNFINSINIVAIILFSALHILCYYFNINIFNYLKITNNIVNKTTFHILLNTGWILYIYSVCYSVVSKNSLYKKYISTSLLIGNICFVIILFIQPFNNVITWTIGNMLYGIIPMLICVFYFLRIHTFRNIYPSIPFSFILGFFNIYWQKILDFIIEQFIINKLQTGNFSEINQGYKMSELITQIITNPLIRNIIYNYNTEVDTASTYLYIHNILIFIILYCSINIQIICSLSFLKHFKNINLVILSYLYYILSLYFYSINNSIQSILTLHNLNNINFMSLNINIITKYILTFVLLYFNFIPYNIMLISMLISTIVQFIYLNYYIFRYLINKFSWNKYFFNTIISIILSLIIYFINSYMNISVIFKQALLLIYGIISYGLYSLYCF